MAPAQRPSAVHQRPHLPSDRDCGCACASCGACRPCSTCCAASSPRAAPPPSTGPPSLEEPPAESKKSDGAESPQRSDQADAPVTAAAGVAAIARRACSGSRSYPPRRSSSVRPPAEQRFRRDAATARRTRSCAPTVVADGAAAMSWPGTASAVAVVTSA
jgi:hypothetical protein